MRLWQQSRLGQALLVRFRCWGSGGPRGQRATMGADGKVVCFIKASEKRDESQKQQESRGPRLREGGSCIIQE